VVNTILSTTATQMASGLLMKIAFVLPGKGISGGVRVTCAMADRLRKRRHDVRILFKHRPSLLDRCKSMRDQLLYTQAEDYLNRFSGRVDAFRNLQDCHFYDDEIIVAVGMSISAEMALLEHLPNPKVQYIHGATPWAPELMQKALSIPIPKIIIASYLREIIESIGSGEILALVPNGINPSEYFRSNIDQDGVGLIYSSHWAKDPGTTLSVIAELTKEHPEVPIRVFGADKRPKDIRPQMYRRYPSVQQARDIYSRSQVWIMASRSEGFSMPVLEAMACGCCVVATDCGGTRDLITDGENGFLVPVEDPRTIVQKVDLLLRSPELRARFQRRGLQTAERFNWERSIDTLERSLFPLVKSYSPSCC
jgi:glycosyltransferase involved in cell wall biosynthesis